VGYNGQQLQVKLSQDYDGEGNPNDFTWFDLSGEAIWPAGDPYFEWTWSQDIDLDEYLTDSIYVAFVYNSNDSDAATWEVDNIKLTGIENSGIEDVEQHYASIYPNPSNGVFTISLNRAFDLVEIYDITGQMVYSRENNDLNFRMNLSGMQPGMYFVKLTDQKHGTSISQRIIIQ
jgi:hypothetical protein